MRNATSGSSGGMREGRVLVSQQTVDALGHEPVLPPPDTGLRLPRPAHDLDRPRAVSRGQNDPCPPDMSVPAWPSTGLPTTRCTCVPLGADVAVDSTGSRLCTTRGTSVPEAAHSVAVAAPSRRARLRRFPKRSSSDFSLSPRRSAGAPHTCRISMQRLCHGIDGMRFSASCPPPGATPIMGKAYALRRRRVIRDSYIILHQLVTRVRGVTHRGSSRAPDRAGSYMAPKLVARRDAHTDESIRA